jgi:signal transduction histidine kinase
MQIKEDSRYAAQETMQTATIAFRPARRAPDQFATQIQRAREEEREHLAREFHDVLGGLLTAARLDVACLKSRLAGQSEDIGRRLEHLNETLRAAFAVKRRIIDGLARNRCRAWALRPRWRRWRASSSRARATSA